MEILELIQMRMRNHYFLQYPRYDFYGRPKKSFYIRWEYKLSYMVMPLTGNMLIKKEDFKYEI